MFLFVHVLTLNKNPGQIIRAPFYSVIDNYIRRTFYTFYFVSIYSILSFFLLEASSPYGSAVWGLLAAQSQSSISGLIIP